MTSTARVAFDASVLEKVAREFGTPTYVYSADVLRAAVDRWVVAAGDPSAVYFAAKANTNLGVLSVLERQGIGIEVATAGERARAEKAGFPAHRILVGGVPKDAATVRDAIGAGLALVVLQADHEVDAAIEAASAAGTPAKVGVRVRPGIRAGAHPSLETGRTDAKFGYTPDEVPAVWARVADAPGLVPEVLAVHLGSGIDSVEPWHRALDVLLPLAGQLSSRGAPVRELDLGGGLAVDYQSDVDPAPGALVREIHQRTAGSGIQVRFEPGRSITARAGVLITRVLYLRGGAAGRPAIVCDAGFTDFSRYALYGAQHRITPPGADWQATAGPVDVLGPTCESGDVIGTGRALEDVEAGDLLVVHDTGAYGFVMASNYNSRPRPAEVLVDGDSVRVVRRRERLEDLWHGELP